MKRGLILLFLLFINLWCYAQLTLEDCYDKAEQNFPEIIRYGLIEKSKEFNLKNISMANVPQAAFSARATYQSEVVSIPINIPGVEIPSLSHDQYQAMLELTQTIWDGGTVRANKSATIASHNVEKHNVDVDMYSLRGRVNDLYFGVLLLNEQINQANLYLEELERNYKKVESYISSGVAYRSDLDLVKVEQLSTQQKKSSMVHSRDAYVMMLSVMIGEKLSNDMQFKKPPMQNISADTEVLRPELKLFDAQVEQLESGLSAIKARNMPKIGAFVQGAYAKPGLNMLSNSFAPYYIAGLRLSWNFGGFYTQKRDKELVAVNMRSVEVGRDLFLYNTRLKVVQQDMNIKSLTESVSQDAEIVALRTSIKNTAEVRVANGAMTVLDMMREVNSEQLAIQNKIVDEVQLLKAVYDLKYSVNR